jgi:hypothetical protein
MKPASVKVSRYGINSYKFEQQATAMSLTSFFLQLDSLKYSSSLVHEICSSRISSPPQWSRVARKESVQTCEGYQQLMNGTKEEKEEREGEGEIKGAKTKQIVRGI